MVSLTDWVLKLNDNATVVGSMWKALATARCANVSWQIWLSVLSATVAQVGVVAWAARSASAPALTVA